MIARVDRGESTPRTIANSLESRDKSCGPGDDGLMELSRWNWLRFACAVTAAASAVAAVFVPAAAYILIPTATGLAGVAWQTPGFIPDLTRR